MGVKPKLFLHGHYHFYAEHSSVLSLKGQDFQVCLR